MHIGLIFSVIVTAPAIKISGIYELAPMLFRPGANIVCLAKPFKLLPMKLLLQVKNSFL
jgi:hypothetical protein